MSGREYTIRRSDGEMLMGEYSFMLCDGPDDWEAADDEQEFNEHPVEYVIERWQKVGEWTRTYAPLSAEDDEPGDDAR